ncbi:MAG: L-2-hydroxyglutarate oxidase [Alphaproteobacteria bacterium]
MKETSDILIVGAGIVGIATALELQKTNSSLTITVIEKEKYSSCHQSGHNSGVVHAGIYYEPESLKAKFCSQGLKATEKFCKEHNLPYNKVGKLIVATNQEEVLRLKKLEERAKANGIVIEIINKAELRKLEPNINGLQALYSPNTAITNYKQIVFKMEEIFKSNGGVIYYDEKVISGKENDNCVVVKTNKRTIECSKVINCAGLHSDKIVESFGCNPNYKIIPFRGEFFRLNNQPDDLVKHLIYPVPNPESPFLGVHLTPKIQGGFTVGPNAVLAFKREGYKLTNFNFKEFMDTIFYKGFWIMLWNNKKSAVSELIDSISKLAYLKRVNKYCSQIKLNDLGHYPAGVRAQAVSLNGKIIDDFLFIETKRCLHIGNAPSPAATSSIPIAKYIVNKININ